MKKKHDEGAPKKVAHDSVTKHEPGGPENVGKSTTRRGEDVIKEENEAGRVHAGDRGESERAAGKSTARESTGVNPQEPIDKESPHLKSGGG